MAVSISTLGVVLVTLIMVLAYALFPFTIFSATANPPNLYGYMADHNEHVTDLEKDLSHGEATLSGLRNNFIPHAKSLVAQIGQAEATLEDFYEAYNELFDYPLWSNVIKEIDELTPDEVAITYIAQDDFQVDIEGLAATNNKISDYAHALIDSELFEDNPDIQWTYELSAKSAKPATQTPQTPQMYDNWPGEATLVTSGNSTPGVDYWAVIVGVADYPDASAVPDLQYTDDDAYDLRDTLLAYGNWEASHITMLIDGAATKENIHDTIAGMGNKTDADDVFFFYFSGHGTTVADEDLDEADGQDEVLCQYDFHTAGGITDDELGEWLATVPCSPVLVAIDTCYSGGMIKRGGVQNDSVAGAGIPQRGDGFAKDLDGVIDGVVLAACADDEFAYESILLENGLFTYYLIEGLEGPADAEGNADGAVSMEEAFDYLQPRVIEASEQAIYIFAFTLTLTPREGG